MKSNLVFLGFVALSLSVSSAQAASTHLTEYEWQNPTLSNRENPSQERNDSVNVWGKTSEKQNPTNSCSRKCSGYSADTFSCNESQELISCEASGCGDYRKCIESDCAPGYNKEFKDCAIDVQEDNYQCSKCID